jgi:hypothetical protein
LVSVNNVMPQVLWTWYWVDYLGLLNLSSPVKDDLYECQLSLTHGESAQY